MDFTLYRDNLKDIYVTVLNFPRRNRNCDNSRTATDSKLKTWTSQILAEKSGVCTFESSYGNSTVFSVITFSATLLLDIKNIMPN